MLSTPPVSVAVLLELVRTPSSGGHVKCWEQFARASVDQPGVDLTVYVLGRRPGVQRVADNVRFVMLRPVLSTGLVQGVVGGVDGSDLTPFHPGLARRLPRHQVWHATHSLAFTATALRLRPRHRQRLVTSVHTDVPYLTGAYTRQAMSGLPAPLRSAATRLGVDRRTAALARHRQDRLLRASDHVLASNDADAADFARAAPAVPLSLLRRGIDTALFRPGAADRGWLARTYGVPTGVPLVLFAGRVDVTKGAPLLAEAVARVRHAGVPAHLVLAGDGAAVPRVRGLLGDGVTHLGNIPQADLARVYAGCDVLAFPSRSETAGNVVPEAMAAGLPVVLPQGARTAQWLAVPDEDGILVAEDEPAAWASALGDLLAAPDRRAAMAQRARETVEKTVPTWADVLREDLLPVWQWAARCGPAGRPIGPSGPRAASPPGPPPGR